VSAKALKTRPGAAPAVRERPVHPWLEETASIVGFFVYLLILKSFFLPLFIIPTGSMAETLYGAHVLHTCPNCGIEYAVSWPADNRPPRVMECPNCRWRQYYAPPAAVRAQLHPDEVLPSPPRRISGDRISVHGWNYDRPQSRADGLGPARWDVVVFKVPKDGQTNYIKRLIGLPGERIELIDGDLFVNDRLARKTRDAQRSLWFPYFNQDYRPCRPAPRALLHFDPRRSEPIQWGSFNPRWVALDRDAPWSGLQTRVIRFDGAAGDRSEIQFVTGPDQPLEPGLIQDTYGYNPPLSDPLLDRPFSDNHRKTRVPQIVTDVRLSAEIEIAAAGPDGYVEFLTANGEHRFYACLRADGELSLQHGSGQEDARQIWGRCRVPIRDGPIRLAIGHVDGTVVVEVDGQAVLESTPTQYEITPDLARERGRTKTSPLLRIAARNVRAAFRHLLIERDVHYTNDGYSEEGPGYGVEGHPITLRSGEYFVLGDNSPSSLDARFSFASFDRQGRREDPVGPHLKEAWSRGAYRPGTVPADQMIGPAFFVYWPGFLPLSPQGPNLLPDLGRARWIR
jgi:signal peptidase I